MPQRPQLRGPTPREPLQRRLRGAVQRQVGEPAPRADGADVHDAAGAAEDGEDGLGEEEGRAHVQVEGGGVVVEGDLGQGDAGVAAGVVDEDVDVGGVEEGEGGLDDEGGGGGVQEVGLDFDGDGGLLGVGLVVGEGVDLVDEGGGLGGAGVGGVGDCDLRWLVEDMKEGEGWTYSGASFGQVECDACANASRCAGHDGDFACKGLRFGSGHSVGFTECVDVRATL